MKALPLVKSLVISLVSVFAFSSCSEDNNDSYGTNVNSAVMPEVLTQAPAYVKTTSALLSGKIVSDGGGRIIESGVVWSTTKDFTNIITLSTSKSISGIGPTNVSKGKTTKLSFRDLTENFDVNEDITVPVSELSPSSTYYFKAYATNEAGTAYGEQYILVTSYGSVTDAEGNEYQTIQMGNQVWMRENLKSTVYSDNTCINGCYNMNMDPDFGRHYTWPATTKGSSDNNPTPVQGACPTGFHVPSDIEWKELLINSGISAIDLENFGSVGYDQGKLFKEAGCAHWTTEGGTNSSGFTVLPAGLCTGPDAMGPCMQTAFWTSTPFVYYSFSYDSDKILRGYNPSNTCGFSVRCIQDLEASNNSSGDATVTVK
jgi:uncharacterized protein (TIGR02145 family)